MSERWSSDYWSETLGWRYCPYGLYYTDLMHVRLWIFPLNIWFYMLASIIGVVCIHVALDNVSKYLKEGLMKDRFNCDNESFEQNEKRIETKYGVNIPMR